LRHPLFLDVYGHSKLADCLQSIDMVSVIMPNVVMLSVKWPKNELARIANFLPQFQLLKVLQWNVCGTFKLNLLHPDSYLTWP